MSQPHAPSIHHDDHGHGHGHDSGHGHGSRFIQHHYDDAKHQFDAGKLGIWLFLVQEVLFFSGLFVAYIVYRAYHPEVFEYAHHYLDTNMGAVNTVVLILSSLTAAWAVRAAQLGQRKLLIACLAVTILCACAFLGVKYIEYSAKFAHGTVWGHKFAPHESPGGKHLQFDAPNLRSVLAPHGVAGEHSASGEHGGMPEGKHDTTKPAADGRASAGETPAAATPSSGPAAETAHAEEAGKPEHQLTEHEKYQKFLDGPPPEHTSMFFSIYFAMTGLHGIHVLGGIFIFIWLLLRAIRGDFTPEYFGPIDFAALYWHLVDLIWIFLFPLLYLIH